MQVNGSSSIGAGAVFSPRPAQAPQATRVQAAVSTTVSQAAGQLQTLQGLARADPAKFKTVASAVATQLEANAVSAGVPSSAAKGLAAAFRNAAHTGEMPAVAPTSVHTPSAQHPGVRAYAAQVNFAPAVDTTRVVGQALQAATASR